MAKFFLLSCLLLFFVSCNGNNCESQTGTVQKAEAPNASCPAPSPNPDPNPNPEPEPEPDPDVPSEALTFDINADLHEFDQNDEVKVEKAFEIIKKVVASSEFRNRVLNFTYQGKKQFIDNKGMTNEEIYQALLEGKENLLPVVDNQMDLELQLYYSWTSTVGYTTPGELRIYMNTKFFDPYTPSEVAGNVFHEWTHKLGFEHASSHSVDRDHSVPYALGYLIEELGQKYE
jgi:hypothetical protein